MKLSVGWMPERRLPDKALDLLDEACARARIPTISSPADLSAVLVVTAHTVAEVLAGWVGVPAEAQHQRSPILRQAQDKSWARRTCSPR